MSNATHRIGASTRITGSVVGSGDLTVAGAIEGNIQLDGSLLLEATAQLVGDVAATAIRIGGKITGNVQVDDKALLERSAELEGDLTATSLSIEAGATLRGRFEANSDPAQLPPARPSRGTVPDRSESLPATERVSRAAPKKPATVAASASTEQLALLSRTPARVRSDEQ